MSFHEGEGRDFHGQALRLQIAYDMAPMLQDRMTQTWKEIGNDGSVQERRDAFWDNSLDIVGGFVEGATGRISPDREHVEMVVSHYPLHNMVWTAIRGGAWLVESAHDFAEQQGLRSHGRIQPVVERSTDLLAATDVSIEGLVDVMQRRLGEPIDPRHLRAQGRLARRIGFTANALAEIQRASTSDSGCPAANVPVHPRSSTTALQRYWRKYTQYLLPNS